MSVDKQSRARQTLMTMRVYTATREGVVVEQWPQVRVEAGEVLPFLVSQAYPPCECPRHRHRHL